MRTLPRLPKQNRLGKKLLLSILAVSALLTLLSTGFQLLLEYRWDLASLEECMRQIEVSNSRSLAESLRSFDPKLVRSQMKGIVALPDVERVELRTSDGQLLAEGSAAVQGRRLTRTFPLDLAEGSRRARLGWVTLISSSADARARLAKQGLVILQLQAVQMLVIIVLLFCLFQLWVTRHLSRMAAYARRLTLHNLDEPLLLQRSPGGVLRPDELDDVVQAANEMRCSLREELAVRRRAEAFSEFLAEASRRLASSLEYHAVTDVICRASLGRLGDAGLCFVGRGEGALLLASFAAPGSKAAVERLPQRLAADARGEAILALGRMVLLEDRTLADRDALLPEVDRRFLARYLGCKAWVLLPLIARGKRVGALLLLVAQGRERAAPSADERELFDEFGRRAAMALDSALLFRDQQDALRMRDDFLSVASHELKTPLTSIHLQVQLADRLAEQRGTEESMRATLRTTLQSIRRQVERLRRLIGGLLDVSHLVAGAKAVEREELDLAALAREVCERMGEQLRAANCALLLRAPAPAWGRWDGSRLDQVITNLLGNAIKFGAGKPIELSVWAPTPHLVQVCVKDEGIGVTTDQQSRIFERYARAVSSQHFSGMGLGLFIVREIVEAHGGRIWVESEPGFGAKFVVELPTMLPAFEVAPRPLPGDGRPAEAQNLGA